MIQSTSLNANTSIYGASWNPMTSSSFDNCYNLSMPFIGMDFTQLLNGDFSSTMQLFNMFMNSQMPKPWQGAMFNKDFNTHTNLSALKNVYNPTIANKLANIAEKNALRTNTHGRCAAISTDSINKADLTNGRIRVGSAYQVDGILENNKNFKEVSVEKSDLKNLPAGCVVVWQPFTDSRNKYHEHGHISVTLGNGKEASDHVQNQVITNSRYSVFVPVGINSKA